MNKKPLDELTTNEFNVLDSLGVLNELYPTESIEVKNLTKYHRVISIFKKILASSDTYDIIKLKKLAKDWLNEYES